ncbi:MAG: Flp pilus assembly complex ATPase component TadA [Phycisphaeraceae bacterium]|nr:Flp pilus assembly complex ATPase component TadA [Phycisphaeraceae bacterium]
MGKYNIDDILSRLGVDEGAPAPARQTPKEEPRKVHTIDQAEDVFSPLPSMPANQRRPGGDKDDPAVRQRKSTPSAQVGDAISEVYRPEEALAVTSGRDLGEMLLAGQAVNVEQLNIARNVVKASPNRRLVDVLVEQGADEAAIQRVVAGTANVPFERIDLEKGLEGGFDGKLLQRLGVDFCKQNVVMPLRMEGARAVIGASRHDDVFLLDEIKRRLGVNSVKLVMVTGYDVRGALEIVGHSTGDTGQDENIESLLADVEETDIELAKDSTEVNDLEQRAGETPVIRYVNHIIQTAIKEGASDIHIEPQEKKLRVRFRIDGVLFEMMNPPASMAAAITSRLKIMANLDIAERRIPQDGRVRCTVQGRKLDLRMSTLPTPTGEKVVLRILDTRSINRNLEELGFEGSMLEIWRQQVDAPHGIVLVTGPTGSGKTTTLYASLRQLDKNRLNISTVEDPVEYHLDGITQTQAHEKIGMTFAVALRALLRQDPDVIMLGEIRDLETAHIAIQAALTGHLVLSTLHTNDAPASITRLVNIGIEPFLVGAAVNGVLAQRLIRRLCTHCKVEEEATEDMRDFLTLQGLDLERVPASKGCERCRGTGYSGRVGIYELLVIDDLLRDVIARNPNVAEFRRMCIERGMVSLQSDGMRKVAQGLTTIEEVMRATSEGH